MNNTNDFFLKSMSLLNSNEEESIKEIEKIYESELKTFSNQKKEKVTNESNKRKIQMIQENEETLEDKIKKIKEDIPKIKIHNTRKNLETIKKV
jgi:hypothetical protein